MNPIVCIPARLRSTRLPDKPLADIHGEPMIVHVWRRAIEADIGPVVVATDHMAIVDAIRGAGGDAILTRIDHPSGTDRIAEALAKKDPDRRYDAVVNFQGDLPTLSHSVPRQVLALLNDPDVQIGTPVAVVTCIEDENASSVVKMVGSPLGNGRFRALYFTRARAPWGIGTIYHHIGLYVWRRSALDRFVMLPPSELELRESLEQLRALEANMHIDAIVVDDVPLGVDTLRDLHLAKLLLAPSLTE